MYGELLQLFPRSLQIFCDFYWWFQSVPWVYFLHSESDVFNVFKIFLAYVETQFSTCIKILWSDSGGEYMSSGFQKYLQTKGIISQRTCLYTPQQNGVAERKNRHLLDVTRSLLLESSVPTHFWVEALATAAHLINRLLSTSLQNQSPYYRLFQTSPSYDHFSDLFVLCTCLLLRPLNLLNVCF